ncbi:unnamed protein product [Lampetra fluviatilis]
MRRLAASHLASTRSECTPERKKLSLRGTRAANIIWGKSLGPGGGIRCLAALPDARRNLVEKCTPGSRGQMSTPFLLIGVCVKKSSITLVNRSVVYIYL